MAKINYQTHLDDVCAAHLSGFFVGWPQPPRPQTLLRALHSSSHVVLARAEGPAVVGFVNALSDGVLAAYIPLLEVLPAYQGQGIGTELMQRLLAALGDLYMVDLVCDPPLNPYYARFEMQPYNAMIRRKRAGLLSER
ncbi:MAG: GNAT family N-acetyltransferase [Anaerolineales bacterium]